MTKPTTSKVKGRVTVKGWAMIDEKGLLYAELTRPDSSIYIGSKRMVRREDAHIVRCTISYTLTNTKARR